MQRSLYRGNLTSAEMDVKRQSAVGSQQQENEQNANTLFGNHATKVAKTICAGRKEMLFFGHAQLVIKSRDKQQQEYRLDQESPDIEQCKIISATRKANDGKEDKQ